MPSKYLIPILGDGSIPHYVGAPTFWRDTDGVTWIEPEPFRAHIVLRNMMRGRSAAYFQFLNPNTGATYSVFMTDFMVMVKDYGWIAGEITSQFIPCKRGNNYGIRLV